MCWIRYRELSLRHYIMNDTLALKVSYKKKEYFLIISEDKEDEHFVFFLILKVQII